MLEACLGERGRHRVLGGEDLSGARPRHPSRCGQLGRLDHRIHLSDDRGVGGRLAHVADVQDDPVTPQGRRRAGIAHQSVDLVAVRQQGSDDAAADEPGSAGYQYAHDYS